MNTERSERKASEFLKKGKKLERASLRHEKTFAVAPEKIFPRLCPSGELDWIEGWDCDLIYTSTGYMEKDCIFTTPETNVFGPGLWINTRYEPNEKLELVRIVQGLVVEHMRIILIDNNDGTCTGIWNITHTAISDAGNAIVKSLPDHSLQLERLAEGLEYFLNTGELLIG